MLTLGYSETAQGLPGLLALRRLVRCLAVIVLVSFAGGASAYNVLLDIDLDGDPGTINTHTQDEQVQVRLVLSPTAPAEMITGISFGLGGTCWECSAEAGLSTYGVNCDLYGVFADWHDNPLIGTSWGDVSLCYGCCNGNGNGDGYHYFYDASAADGGFLLTEPIFVATFTAWVDRGHIFDRCPHPPSNMIIFPRSGDPAGTGNEIQITDEFTPVATVSWGTIKSLY
jgi:hypothetical protein